MNDKNRAYLDKLFRWIKLHKHKIKRIPDTPHNIALGAAIGVFWGIFPTFMIGAILAVGTAALLKANKASSIIGSFIMNPLTSPFFWAISAYLGGLVTNQSWKEVLLAAKNLDFMKNTIWIYLIGNTLVSIIFSYFTYLLILVIIKEYQQKRNEKFNKKNL